MDNPDSLELCVPWPPQVDLFSVQPDMALLARIHFEIYERKCGSGSAELAELV